ncbi:MAG: hypothetical protein STSR0001_25510 [Methanothrix sp.]
MGKRGPKPRFLDVACPNEQCSQFGITGEGNVTVYGTYQMYVFSPLLVFRKFPSEIN